MDKVLTACFGGPFDGLSMKPPDKYQFHVTVKSSRSQAIYSWSIKQQKWIFDPERSKRPNDAVIRGYKVIEVPD